MSMIRELKASGMEPSLFVIVSLKLHYLYTHMQYYNISLYMQSSIAPLSLIIPMAILSTLLKTFHLFSLEHKHCTQHTVPKTMRDMKEMM